MVLGLSCLLSGNKPEAPAGLVLVSGFAVAIPCEAGRSVATFTFPEAAGEGGVLRKRTSTPNSETALQTPFCDRWSLGSGFLVTRACDYWTRGLVTVGHMVFVRFVVTFRG